MAGMPHRLARMLRGRSVRSPLVLFGSSPFEAGGPDDHIDPSWSRLSALIREASLIHVHGLATYSLLRPELASKPFLVHIHGTPDRASGYLPAFPHVVATPDLLDDFPQATFIPNMIERTGLEASAPFSGAEPLRIFKSPSLHDKHQKLFAKMVGAVADRIGERMAYVAPAQPMPHRELCALRASCHISLDHLHGYYGLESLEALAQGLVAVNGLSAVNRRRVASVLGSAPPFAIAREPAAVGQLLITLVQEALTDPARFAARRAKGPAYMAQVHSEEALAELWLRTYRALEGTLDVLGGGDEQLRARPELDAGGSLSGSPPVLCRHLSSIPGSRLASRTSRGLATGGVAVPENWK